MDYAEVQIQHLGGKGGKSGKQILDRYRELVKERESTGDDVVTVSSSDSASVIPYGDKENTKPEENVGLFEAKNLSLLDLATQADSNEESQKGKVQNDLNIIEYTENSDKTDENNSRGHTNEDYPANDIRYGASVPSNDNSDSSLALSDDISGLSQILNSSYFEDKVNYDFDTSESFEKNLKILEESNTPNLKQPQDHITNNNKDDPPEVNVIRSELHINLMNESLVSYPVSVQSEPTPPKTEGELICFEKKSESSLVISDDDNDISRIGSFVDDMSKAACNTSCNDNTKASISSEFMSPMTPLTAMRRNSVQLALDDSQAYMQKIEQLSHALEKSEKSKEIEFQRRLKCEHIIKKLSSYSCETPQKSNSLQSPESFVTPENNVNTSVVISPISKVLSLEDTPGKLSTRNSKSCMDSTTKNLMERNLTLVKEVRFADQTCVELSEKNQALKDKEVYLEEEISKMKEEMQKSNANLVHAEKNSTKMEEKNKSLQYKLNDQQKKFEEEILNLKVNLKESKSKEEAWKNQADIHYEEKVALTEKLNLNCEKHELVVNNFVEAKEKIASLTERVSSYENIFESKQNDSNEIQVMSMQDKLRECKEELEKEKERNRILLMDRSYLEGQLLNQISDESIKDETACEVHIAPESGGISSYHDESSIQAHSLQRDFQNMVDVERKDTDDYFGDCDSRGAEETMNGSLDVSLSIEEPPENFLSLQRKLKNAELKLTQYQNDYEQLKINQISDQNVMTEYEAKNQYLIEKDGKLKLLVNATKLHNEQVSLHIEQAIVTISQYKEGIKSSEDEKVSAIEQKMCGDNLQNSIHDMKSHLEEMSQNLNQIEVYLKESHENLYTGIDSAVDEWDSRSLHVEDSGSREKSYTSSPENKCALGSSYNEYDNVLDATFSCDQSVPEIDESRLIVLLEEARTSAQQSNTSVESSSPTSNFAMYTTGKISRLREELRKSDVSRADIEKDYESILLMLDETHSKMDHYKEIVSRIQTSHNGEVKIIEDELSKVKIQLKNMENEKLNGERIATEKRTKVDEENESLRLEIRRNKSDVDLYKEKLQQMQDKNELLRNDSDLLTKTQASLLESERKSQLSSQKIASLQEVQSHLEEKIKGSNENLCEAQKQIEILESEQATLQSKIQELSDFESLLYEAKDRCKEIEGIAVELREQNNDLEDEVEEKIKISKTNETRIEELQSEMVKTKDILDGLTRDKKEDEKTISMYETTIAKTNEKQSNLDAEILSLRSQITETSDQLQRKTMICDDLEKELKEVSSEYEDRKLLWNQTLEEKDALFVEFRDLSSNENILMQQNHLEKINNMEAEMNLMVQTIALLESELAATKFEGNSERNKLNENLLELNRNIQDLEGIITEEKNRYLKLKDIQDQELETSSLVQQNEIKRLNLSIRETDSENTELKSRVKSMQDRLYAIGEEMSCLSENLDKSNNECNSTKYSLRKREKEKKLLEDELASSLDDYDRLKAMNSRKIEKLSLILKEMAVAKDRVNMKLSKKEECIKNLHAEINLASKELHKWKEKDNDNDNDKIEYSTHLLKERKEKHESLERKCIRLREYIAKLTEKCEEWASSYRSLSKELKKCSEDKAFLLKENDSLRGEINGQGVSWINNDEQLQIECKYLRKAIKDEGERNMRLQNELSEGRKGAFQAELSRQNIV